jgi:hypothetical protein
VTFFGPDIEAIMFRTSQELNTKLDYYLARPAERREIVETLRAAVSERRSSTWRSG